MKQNLPRQVIAVARKHNMTSIGEEAHAGADLESTVRHEGGVALVLENQLSLSVSRVDSPHVMKPGIAIVDPDQDLVGEVLVGRNNAGLNRFERRQIKFVAGFEIHRIQLEVLVPSDVLCVNDLIVIVGP